MKDKALNEAKTWVEKKPDKDLYGDGYADGFSDGLACLDKELKNIKDKAFKAFQERKEFKAFQERVRRNLGNEK